MTTGIESLVSNDPWLAVLTFILDLTIKSSIVCLVAAAATLVLRRSSAFVRSTVWVSAIIGLLLLPAFSLQSPVWTLPVLPDLASLSDGSYQSSLDKNGGSVPSSSPAATVDAPALSGAVGQTASDGIPWFAWGILLWVTGGIGYLAWYLVSQVGVRSIVRQARPADGRWARLLGHVSNELDVRRSVRLLESDRLNAAITYGILDPVIVVPTNCEEWPASRRRLVLSHELAHVKRWDTLTEIFALFAMMLYWFNPLVWLRFVACASSGKRIATTRSCKPVQNRPTTRSF